MRLPLPPASIRLGFAAIASLAILGIAAPPAQAGCSDHVLAASEGGDVLRLADFGRDDGEAPAAPRPPCSGPGCSQAPAFPPLAPAAPPGADRAELWGCLLSGQAGRQPLPGWCRVEADPNQPILMPSPLDRPPRA